MRSTNHISVIILMVVFAISPGIKAQFAFKNTFGHSMINEGRSIKTAFDGGYIIAGNTSTNNMDAYVLKINVDGSFVWDEIYGGTGVENIFSLIKTFDSCYVMAGFSNGYNPNNNYEIILIKIDIYGQLLWQKQYGGSDWNFAYDIKQTSDSGFIIAGNSYTGNSGNSDAIMIKTDNSGNETWRKIFNCPENDYLYGVTLTSDGGYISAGTRTDGHNGSKDIIAAKTDANGDSVWYKSFGTDSLEEGLDIIAKTNTYMIVGCNKDDQKLNNLSLRIGENGDSLSTNLLAHSEDEITSSIDTTGIDFWITGYTSSFGGGKRELFISKVDSMGADIRGTTAGGSEDEEGFSVIATEDGGAIAVGYSKSFQPGNQSLFVVKIDTGFNTGSVLININETYNKLKILTVYPNPVISEINITSNYLADSNLSSQLYDLTGKLIQTTTDLKSRKIFFDRSKIGTGVYQLVLYNSSGILFKTKLLFK